mmetsp:Transcript_19116/g.62447  ORF Transcript_19116/g.62447 Transcript_19116/m.62447 type:complete len:209 (-) Transcript_19116:128-754(-)
MEHGKGAEPARGFAAGGRARHPPTPRRCSAGRLRGLHRPTSGRPRRWQLRRRRRSYRRRAPGLCQRLPSSAEMIGTLLGRMPCRGCIRRGPQPVVQHVGVIQTHRREHLREGPINRGHSPRLLRILIPVLETAALLCGILDRPLLLHDSTGGQLERGGELCKRHRGPMMATVVVTMIHNFIIYLRQLLLAQVACQSRRLAHRQPASQS